MPSENPIERFMCGVKKLNGYSQPYMSPAVQGEYVRYEDARSLEDQLATLRSEIAYVRGHLEGYASALDLFPGEQDKLSDALREDASRLEKLGGGK